MSPKPFHLAVVGYGVSAKIFHIPFILTLPEDFKLYGIVQRSPKPDDDAAKDHDGIKSWRSVEEMYADTEVDVVVLTTVPETHFEMAQKSLEAGKHVVVEKPFVATAAEAAELAHIAKKHGKKLTVYQNRRWDADFLTLRKIMAGGLLGDISEFETHFDRHRPDPPPHSWKDQDKPTHGSLYELGTHLIDQVYHLFGMPRRVTAFMGIQRRGVAGGAHDSHTVLLHYDGPMLVTVKASVISPAAEQLRYWVRGTKGSFQKVCRHINMIPSTYHFCLVCQRQSQFHLDRQEDQLLFENIGPGHKDFAVDPESHYGRLITMESTKATPAIQVYPTLPPVTYAEYYRILAQALRGQGEVPVTAEDARDVLHIIELAKQSSREGRTIDL